MNMTVIALGTEATLNTLIISSHPDNWRKTWHADQESSVRLQGFDFRFPMQVCRSRQDYAL